MKNGHLVSRPDDVPSVPHWQLWLRLTLPGEVRGRMEGAPSPVWKVYVYEDRALWEQDILGLAKPSVSFSEKKWVMLRADGAARVELNPKVVEGPRHGG